MENKLIRGNGRVFCAFHRCEIRKQKLVIKFHQMRIVFHQILQRLGILLHLCKMGKKSHVEWRRSEWEPQITITCLRTSSCPASVCPTDYSERNRALLVPLWPISKQKQDYKYFFLTYGNGLVKSLESFPSLPGVWKCIRITREASHHGFVKGWNHLLNVWRSQPQLLLLQIMESNYKNKKQVSKCV